VNDGSENWVVTGPENAACRIRVQAAIDTIVFDSSEATFAINPAPSLLLYNPDPNDAFVEGSNMSIGWTSTGIMPSVRILLTRDSAPAETLFASTPNDGSASWTVTGPDAVSAVLRIESATAAAVFDDVSPIAITVPQSVHWMSPVSGDSFAVGDSLLFSWTTSGAVGPLRLLISRGVAAAETLFSSTVNDGSEIWQVTAPATDSAAFRLEAIANATIFDLVQLVEFSDTLYAGPPFSPEIVAFAAADSLRLIWPPAAYATGYRVESSGDFVTWDSLTTTVDTVFALPTPELVPPARYYRVIGIR
jgi:hypothetical protein